MMKRAFVTNNLRFSVRNKAAAKLRKPPKVFSVCFLTSKTDYLRIFSPFSVFYGFNIARIDINFKWVRILSARLTPPRRRDYQLKVENVGADIIRPFKKRRFAREHLIRQNLRFCHLPLKGKAEWLNLAGWDYNPSVCFADTSLCTREAFRIPSQPSRTSR